MKSLLKLPVLLILFSTLLMQACLDTPTDDSEARMTQDIATIDSYLTSNGITAIKDVAGIRMEIHELGTGLVPLFKNSVTVDYEGRVLGSSTVFDNGTANGELRNYVAGWQYALTTLPVGTKATIYIPSPLGYGEQAKPNIPPNSILVFEVDLKAIYISQTEVNQFKTDTTAINTYLAEKNIIDFIKDPTGVRYRKTLEVQTSAPMPTLYDKVKFKISIKLLSDDTKEVFAVLREPTEFSNGRVVDNLRAITAVLPYMKEGENARLYVPSYLALNTDALTDGGQTLIPANSVLIIDLELQEVL